MFFYVQILYYCYLLAFPIFSLPSPPIDSDFKYGWDEVNIVDDLSLDHEDDDSIYCKTIFQPTSFLSPGYGVLFEHTRTIYQSVHRHHLIVGMKLPTHNDIPSFLERLANLCIDFSKTPDLLQGQFPDQKEVNCSHTPESLKHFEHWSALAFSLVHSELPALLPNQTVKMMSKEHLPFSTVDLNGNTHKNWFVRDTSYNTTINPSFELEYIQALAYYE